MVEQLIKPYRVNNIEFRPSVSITTQLPYYEIVKWGENTFYGKENEFEKTELGGFRHKEFGYSVSENIFKIKEMCYTLAFFVNMDEMEPDLRTVGKRPFELDAKEWLDFLTVMNYGFDKIKEKYLEKYD